MRGFDRQEWRFTALISLTHLSQHFLARLLPPLLPVLAVALEYPLWKLGLLVTLFSLGSGLAQAPLGVLSDRYDRLYILPTGIGVAGAGYIVFAGAVVVGPLMPGLSVRGHGFEGEFVVMAVAMLIVGLGSAVVHPTGYPMITANVSGENKGKALGMFGASAKFGDAAAPAVIAVLILVLVWTKILLILGLLGVAVGIGLFAFLRGGEYETVPVGRKDGNGNGDECDGDGEANLDRRSYLYPMTAIYFFFVNKMFTGTGINTFIPVYMVGVYSYSFEVLDVQFAPESVANFYFAALLLAAGVTQLVLGSLTDKYDSRFVLLCCLGVAGIGLLGLVVLTVGPVLLLVTMLVLGAGLWGLNPARDDLISDITPPEREGRTFGYIWTAAKLTGAVIPVVVGYLMDVLGPRDGFLILLLGIVFAGLSISLLYSDRVYRPEPERMAQQGD